jgi:dUTP pyrophosphatase
MVFATGCAGIRYGAPMLDLPIRILDPELVGIPAYARDGDAAADLVARCGVELAPGGGRALIPTGIALQLPRGYAALVLSRSGLAARSGIACLNAPGLIDSGFRGEVQVLLVNTDPEHAYVVERGDRIAQLLVMRVEEARFLAVDELEESERGEGGFGHTGR